MKRWSYSWSVAAILLGIAVTACAGAEAPRPNILWLTSEDHGPQMGCYGDPLATTPHVDALAARGVRFNHCWSNAPVCAPARTTLISGLYPPSTGGEHMRSMVAYPRHKQMFPQLLRAAGYYCTNNAKEDYNLSQPGRVWDDSSKKAHWKNRAAGQPFFAVFNSEKSHESKVRVRPHVQIHDPAKVRVPAYHPDTPEVRQDWAQYYDCVSEADADAGNRLKQLEADGLADETIVFYFADHGPGMPRSKRWPRESGLHVPLVVYIPQRFRALRSPDDRPGGASDRLVSFVDFASTVLSLAGIEPPDWMQGHAFLGHYQTPPQPFLFGFRGRMDERSDLIRCVTDGRYVYIRNFRPDKIYGQYLAYMWQTPTTRVWEQMFKAGKLNEAQSAFWKTKPPEELYDLAADPDEVHNLAGWAVAGSSLAGSAEQSASLERLREALSRHLAAIRDVGFLPEGEIHRRSIDTTPYDMGHDPSKYPFERVYETAALASSLAPAALPKLKLALHDPDSAVRYWAVLGHLMQGSGAVAGAHRQLVEALDDVSPDVRIAAAETLIRYGSDADRALALPLLGKLADWSHNDLFTVMAALNAISAIGDRAAPLRDTIAALPAKGPAPSARYQSYVPRLLDELRESEKK